VLHLLVLGGCSGSLGHNAGTGAVPRIGGRIPEYIMWCTTVSTTARAAAHTSGGAQRCTTPTTPTLSEKNFGVASSFWDRVFGTYFVPRGY
jgi:hypothetical protein